MPDLEPITREETLLDGGDLTPITRKEMFIKRIYDKTQTIPEPITREEYFLKKAGEASSDVTIEQLNVTQNGTYSESGKAYSPVVVNVPIPENAYLLNEVEDLPADIASFIDGQNLPMPTLKIGIEPIQEGSGDPSPTNIRPISGHTEANVSVTGVNIWDEEWETGGLSETDGAETTNTNYVRSDYIPIKGGLGIYGYSSDARQVVAYLYKRDKSYIGFGVITNKAYTMPSNTAFFRIRINNTEGEVSELTKGIVSINYPSTDTSYRAYNGQTYNIQFKDGDNPLTVYGGTLDVTSGELVVDRAYLTIDDFNSFGGSGTSAGGLHWFDVRNKPKGKSGNKNICSILGYVQNGWTSTIAVMSVDINDTISVRIYDSSESLSDFKDKYPNLQLVYELATPITYHLTPTQVKSLLQNNIWADTGEVLEAEYFTKGE